MKKGFLNNLGYSLMEVSLAVGILGINSLALMRLQSDFVKNGAREKAFDSVSSASQVIEKVLKDSRSCTDNLKQKSSGDEFDTLDAALIDANFKNDLGNGLKIKSYKIVQENNQDYLEVLYEMSAAKKKLGLQDVTRRYMVNAIKDSSNTIIECQGELEDKKSLVSSFNCEKNGFKLDSNGNCKIDEVDIIEVENEECKRGARHQLVYEQGKIIKKCLPCTPIPKFIRTKCEKKFKSMNWVNVCYYRETCKEDTSQVFGTEYFTRGATKAKGGDTGREKSCYKKRVACAGEKKSSGSQDAGLEGAILAEEYAEIAIQHEKSISDYIDDKDFDSASKLFNELKSATDQAVAARVRAEREAKLYNTKEARENLERAKIAEGQAKSSYENSLNKLIK